MKIRPEWIDWAQQAGACAEAMEWLQANPDAELEGVPYTYRIWAVQRADLPEDLIRQLGADTDPWVREGIAWQDGLPEDLIRALAVDPDYWVRAGIAWQDELPEDLIRQLGADTDPWVREEIARQDGGVYMSTAVYIDEPTRYPRLSEVGVAVGDRIIHAAYRTRCPEVHTCLVHEVGAGDLRQRWVVRTSELYGPCQFAGNIELAQYRLVQRRTTPGEKEGE